MQKDGEYVIFTDRERDILNLGDLINPVHIDQIDVLGLEMETQRIEGQLNEIMFADDDEALHSERGFITSAGNLLAERRRAVKQLMSFWMNTEAN